MPEIANLKLKFPRYFRIKQESYLQASIPVLKRDIYVEVVYPSGTSPKIISCVLMLLETKWYASLAEPGRAAVQSDPIQTPFSQPVPQIIVTRDIFLANEEIL